MARVAAAEDLDRHAAYVRSPFDQADIPRNLHLSCSHLSGGQARENLPWNIVRPVRCSGHSGGGTVDSQAQDDECVRMHAISGV